jgi:hypothetical protein
MRNVHWFTLAALLALAAPAGADLGPLEPLADLHRAVHESLGLPEPLIVRLLERGLPEEQLPVVGLLAQRASVAPEAIVELHAGGLSFLDISIRFGLGPEIFYVPIAADPGPPYGKAWGYYKKTPRARWNTIVLSDREVVDLANLKLCVDHYRVPPEQVIVLRRQGQGFAVIHGELAGHGKGKAAASGKDKGKKAKPDKPGKPGR